MVKLVPIGDVRASEYNPRKNDEKRLALTEMSLRKLGFCCLSMRIRTARYYPGISAIWWRSAWALTRYRSSM